LPLEAKIQNGEWIPFCQKFCMVFSSILQNDGPKPKIFWVNWGTKHTPNGQGFSTNFLEKASNQNKSYQRLV
jgi:hypothetical protein